jgi:hypothetical protein
VANAQEVEGGVGLSASHRQTRASRLVLLTRADHRGFVRRKVDHHDRNVGKAGVAREN